MATEMRVGGPRRQGRIEGLADDLVEDDLGPARQRVSGLDVEVYDDALRKLDLVGERLNRRPEALVAEDHWLEGERQVTQLADRLPLAADRLAEDLLRVVDAAVVDRVDHAVEHQGDSGHGLNRHVVEEQRESPALVLLGRDQLVRMS